MVEPTYRPGVLSESGLLPIAMGDTTASLEEIKRRRAIAAALATRSRPFPKTIGEGLTSLGEAFGDVMADQHLSAQERAYAGGRAADPLFRPPGSNPAAGAVAAPRPVSAIPAVEPNADPRARIAAIANPNDPALRPPGVASPDPTQAGATEPPQTSLAFSNASPADTGTDDPIWAARQGAIGGIESRGQPDPYQAVGAPTKYGRGLGRYQVVEANIGPWTEAALGQALTPQQYLASPQAQDAVFKHRFGQYVDQFGEEGAARAWFGGPGNVNKGDLTDAHKRLSIADYGKSYMAGLQAGTDPTRLAYASTGSVTDAPSPAARGGGAIPPLTEENPVTPSDITPAPTMVAQLGGGAVRPIPTPFDKPTPEPATPPVTTAPVLAGSRKPLGLPPAPDRAGEPLSDEELRGISIMRKYPGDEQAEKQAKLLMEYGKARRDEAYARRVEEYKSRVDLEKSRTLAEEEFARKLPGETETRQRAAEKDAHEKRMRELFPDGVDKAYSRAQASAEKVAALPAAQQAIAGVRQVMNSKAGMFTGADAGIDLGLSKIAAAFGVPVDPRTSNTEIFRGLIPPILASLRPAIVGAGAQSLPEFNLLQEAAAGKITLERRSIEEILNSIEKLNAFAAVQHHKVLKANSRGDPNVEATMYGSYELPIDKFVPPGKVQLLRDEVMRNPDKAQAEMDEFDKAYFTPGLARRILGK